MANCKVRIELDGQRLRVTPPCPDVLGSFITSNRIAQDDPDHGYRVVEQVENLLTGELPCPTAGLEWVVWLALVKAGYTVERCRTGPGPRGLPEPDLQSPRWIGLYDGALLEFVRRHDHGLIRYGQAALDVAWLIAQIAIAFPGATIAMATASKEKMRKLAGRLRAWLPGVATATAKYEGNPEARVVVGTFIRLADVDVEKRDIVIADAAEGICERGQQALEAAWRARLFGLLPEGIKLAPREEDRIAATFGLEEVYVLRHGQEERPVEVAWMPVRGGPSLGFDSPVVDLLRKGVWHHELRNRRIARLAAAIATQETEWLGENVPEVAEAVREKGSLQVGVAVQNIEHAVALAKRLPNSPVITGEEIVEDGLAPNELRLLRGRRSGALVGPPILTAVGLGRVGVEPLDVLIWAGAGSHRPPLPGGRPVCPADRARPLLVIDVADRHHPVLRKWTGDRRTEYRDAGWFPAGMHPAHARAERFLARRRRPS